jgi:signal transduction histidine kinase/sugar lactone lactonase YvrE
VVDRYQRLERMHHTAWTARDGLAGEPSSLAQTADGFLWIGTSDGLYRFDGIRLEAYSPTEGAIAARAVSTLTAAPDGGLWVGHQSGGVTFIDAKGRATTYSAQDSLPVARIRSIAVDLDGTVWVAAVGGLARLTVTQGKQWKKVRSDWGYPNLSAWNVFVDHRGNVWVGAASPNGVLFLPRGSRRFIDLGVTGSALGFGNLDDSTIVYAHQRETTIHLVRLRGDSAVLFQSVPDLPSAAMAVDRDRAVWIAGRGASRLRLTSNPGGGSFAVDSVERFTSADGLSGQVGASLLVDREGTVWMATKQGIDRFRRRNLTWDPDSTITAGASLITDTAGRVWILGFRAPSLRNAVDGVTVPNAPTPLDNGYVDRDGSLLLSDQQALFRWDGKAFTPIPPPKEVIGKNLRFTVVGTTRDRSGRLWISVGGSGVFFRDDSTWTFKPILPGRPDMAPPSMAADDEGRMWFVYRDELAMVQGDRVRVFTADDGLTVGSLTSVRTAAGRVWVGGERGLALLHGERFHPVNAAPGASLGVITGMVPTSGGLWLTTSTGIGHLPNTQMERLSANPAAPIRIDLFDLVTDLPDPMRYVARPFKWVTEAADGVLWFITRTGVAKVDPRQIVRNRLPPPIAFRSVIADDSSFSPHGNIRLPPLTRTLRIEYTALSLVVPERVRFRHRLVGWENIWHDAGDRREVTYTDLRPGDYSLRLTASNNDGVWNEDGATLQFTVAPAWFQTAWFRILIVAALLGAMAVAYRIRIRRVSAALAARYDERLAERTRIARELHDTLLQTVHGSKIVADDALDQPDDVERLRDAMRRVSGWLGQAAQEGRAALNSLRLSTAEHDLADALRRAADDPVRPPNLNVVVQTSGVPRALHPVVQAEIYRIGLEGIRNACLHSGATRLTIELAYGHDLVLSMTDNGVGMAPAVAESGKAGRFGIPGMRERAANIGGTVTIEPANPGTRVTLTVPGRSVFATSSSSSPSG